MTPSLSLAQSGSGQGGNRSVPKKEREIHGVDYRVVFLLFPGHPRPSSPYIDVGLSEDLLSFHEYLQSEEGLDTMMETLRQHDSRDLDDEEREYRMRSLIQAGHTSLYKQLLVRLSTTRALGMTLQGSGSSSNSLTNSLPNSLPEAPQQQQMESAQSLATNATQHTRPIRSRLINTTHKQMGQGVNSPRSAPSYSSQKFRPRPSSRRRTCPRELAVRSWILTCFFLILRILDCPLLGRTLLSESK